MDLGQIVGVGWNLVLVGARADSVVAQVLERHLREVVAVEIGDGELAEDVVDNRGRHLDAVVAANHARGFEAGEDEGVYVLFERHAVLETERHRNCEAIHQGAEGGTFTVHIEENLADRTGFVLAGADIDLVATHRGLLGEAGSPAGKAVAASLVADHDPLGHRFGDLCRIARGHRFGQRLLFLDVHRDAQRLAQLGSVTVERYRFEHFLPGKVIGALDVVEGRFGGHVDGLGDGARDEGLGRRHHQNMAVVADRTGAALAATIGAVEDRQVLGREMGGALDGHRSAGPGVGGLDLFDTETETGEDI